MCICDINIMNMAHLKSRDYIKTLFPLHFKLKDLLEFGCNLIKAVKFKETLCYLHEPRLKDDICYC